MSDGDWDLRVLDRFEAGRVAHVGQVDKDAEPVHLPDRVESEVAQPFVATLPATVSEKVSFVIRHLDDLDAEIVENREAIEVVFDGGRVLKSEDNADSAVLLRLPDVIRRPNGCQCVLVLTKPLGPSGQVVQGLHVVFPGDDGCVDRRHAAGVQAAKDFGAVPVTDVQSVDHEGVIVYAQGSVPSLLRVSNLSTRNRSMG